MPASLAYFDTSVLVRRYVDEPGTAHARSLLRRHSFLSSAITPVEATSALARRREARELPEEDYLRILARMRRDRAYWTLIEVDQSVLGRAEEITATAGLRTLDAIHVASATVFQSASRLRVPFITADDRQRHVAERLGLEVVWGG